MSTQVVEPQRRRAFLTVDLEDYRRQELHRQLGSAEPHHAGEVERQLEHVLESFDACGVRATFFTVGRLTSELPASAWKKFSPGHRIGCHGHEHLHVFKLGPDKFQADLVRARAALEDCLGAPVVSFRAPYFSSDGCDPWFGEGLARAGFRLDSSRRIFRAPPGFNGSMPLPGAGGAVLEVPLPSLGLGRKRLTVIGGTYFRLLPLSVIRKLLKRAEQQGFVPMVYLHPYDLDPEAAPLALPKSSLVARAGDLLRRTGRGTVMRKLRALAREYEFNPIEALLESTPPQPNGGS